MHSITIREGKKSDSSSICHIHRNCDDPWNNEKECNAWVSNRIDRGFYIQLGIYQEKIVAHGEWVISDQPDSKILYLGLLQVDSDYQGKGIGRAMVEDGALYAKKVGCQHIATIPDTETGSQNFYEKCGFRRSKEIICCTIETEGHHDNIERYRIHEVPYSVVREKSFLFGLCQASSRHMWEVTNKKPITDEDRNAPAICLDDRSIIQVSYFEPKHKGLALCWSNSKDYIKLICTALSFGNSLGLKKVDFVFYEELTPFFLKWQPEAYLFEMTRDV